MRQRAGRWLCAWQLIVAATVFVLLEEYIVAGLFVCSAFLTLVNAGGPLTPLRGADLRALHERSFVAAGYENVRTEFRKHFEEGTQAAAQCVVFVGGRCVVNLATCLVGSSEAKLPYTENTLQNVFSSGKMLEAVAVAMLVDKGLLAYNDPIAKHWPEFGTNGGGKAHITVAQLMRHEAGIERLDRVLPLESLQREALLQTDTSISARILASQRRGTNRPFREYHAQTRGLYLNEIVIRATHKTLGQFVADEIATPLGLAKDIFVGVPQDQLENVAAHRVPWTWWALAQSLLPAERLGGVAPCILLWPASLARRLFPSLTRIKTTQVHRDPVEHFNDPRVRAVEMSSANVHANAYAMARIMSDLAVGQEGGGGGRLLSTKGLQSALGGVELAAMILGRVTKFTCAGFHIFDDETYQDRDGFVGWAGFGGSAMMFHPQLKIGFACANTQMASFMDANSWSWALQREVLTSVHRLQKEANAEKEVNRLREIDHETPGIRFLGWAWFPLPWMLVYCFEWLVLRSWFY